MRIPFLSCAALAAALTAFALAPAHAAPGLGADNFYLRAGSTYFYGLIRFIWDVDGGRF